MVDNSGVGKDGGHPIASRKRDALFPRRAGLYIAIGFELPSTILGGLLAGYFLDGYFDSSPWFLIGLTFLAFVGATVRLVQWAKVFSKSKHDGKSANDPPPH